jgi:hypothetical protein
MTTIVADNETAAMFEPNVMRDETSGVGGGTYNFRDASAASLIRCARHFGGSP